MTPLKNKFLEYILSAVTSFFCFKLVYIAIKNHNGVDISEYPEYSWILVPFPSQKGQVFNADNLATVNRHDFVNDPRFQRSKKKAEDRWVNVKNLRDISWRLHTILWAYGLASAKFRRTDAIFVECGTGAGYMAAGISDYYSNFDKKNDLYLIDAFSTSLQLTKTTSVKSPAKFAYTDNFIEVKEYFAKYQFITVLKGFIPDVLSELPMNPIGFLHVDLNNVQGEVAALDALSSRLLPGSVIIFDDYGGPGGGDQASAHEEFANTHDKNLLILPTGQAIIIW